MHVRFGKFSDIQSLVELALLTHREHYDLLPNLFAPVPRPREWEDRLGDKFPFVTEPSAEILIAQSEDEIAGGLVFSPEYTVGQDGIALDASSIYIDLIAVFPNFRQSGAAKLLVAEVKKLALTQPLSSIQCDVWAGNHASATLFTSAGFQEANTRFRYDLESD